MSNVGIKSPRVYSKNIRAINVTDPVHASILNQFLSTLINNDVFLAEAIEKIAEVDLVDLQNGLAQIDSIDDKISDSLRRVIGNIDELNGQTLLDILEEMKNQEDGGTSLTKGDLEARRLITSLFAKKELEGLVSEYSGMFFDLFNGITEESIAKIDLAKARSLKALKVGDKDLDVLYFDETKVFKEGQEVTIYDDVSREIAHIEKALGDRVVLKEGIKKNYKSNVNIARSIVNLDTEGGKLDFGTWDYYTVTLD